MAFLKCLWSKINWSLFERSFKGNKNGIFFFWICYLVPEIFKVLLRKRLLLFIVLDTITISVLSFVSRCCHFETIYISKWLHLETNDNTLILLLNVSVKNWWHHKLFQYKHKSQNQEYLSTNNVHQVRNKMTLSKGDVCVIHCTDLCIQSNLYITATLGTWKILTGRGRMSNLMACHTKTLHVRKQ